MIHFETSHVTMSEFSYSFSMGAENWMHHIGEPVRPLPISVPSKATLEALKNISRNAIPLVGFAHPNRGLIPSFIRDVWQLSEQTLRMRELVAGSHPVPLNGNPDFGPIESPAPKFPLTPTLSPVQSDAEPPEWDSDAPGPSQLPQAEMWLEKSHGCFFPPTPAISPTENGEVPTEFSLDDSAIPSTENEAEDLLATGRLSSTSQVRGREAHRKAVRKALNSLHNRRPREWSDMIPEVIARGELASLHNIMGLPDRSGCEY